MLLEQTKDQHFNQMATAKDAKIMNLIEGTDVQQMLIKHQLELVRCCCHCRAWFE